MEYKEFVKSIGKWSNGDAFTNCGCEVPRNDKGWPTIDVSLMDNMQVLFEAFRWVSVAEETGRGTVGHMMWDRYSDELVRRELMDHDCQSRYDILKILEKGWNTLPPGPIVVDPTVPPPIQVDPKKRSIVGRTARAVTRALRRMLPKP